MGNARAARNGGWGLLVAAWCLLFAALHVFWASGGELGLATSAGAELATHRPRWFVLVGLWGVAALLLAGAWFGAGLSRWRIDRPVPRRVVLALGWIAGGVLLVRALAVEVALLGDLGGVTMAVGPGQTRASLLLWNPWFALGGLLLVLATRRFQRAGRGVVRGHRDKPGPGVG